MNHSMKVGVDLDGVVYNFVEAFQQYLINFGGYEPDELPYDVEWEMWESWPMSKEQFFRFFAEGVAEQQIWITGDPYPGAKEGLEALRAAGHTIHIVTHRNGFPEGPSSTAWWLKEHGIPFDTLTFAADKTCVPVDVFIEDYVPNVLALTKAGTHAVLMNRPWNVNVKGIFRRVENWDEFVNVVQAIEACTEKARAERPEGLAPASARRVADFVYDPEDTFPELAITSRSRLLSEAIQITHGDRNASYGSPTQNFQDTADVWTVQFRHLLADGKRFKPADIARAMIGLKLVRMIASDKWDNWLDIAGYAGCGAECLEDEKATTQ